MNSILECKSRCRSCGQVVHFLKGELLTATKSVTILRIARAAPYHVVLDTTKTIRWIVLEKLK